jgi:hypothetical protein
MKLEQIREVLAGSWAGTKTNGRHYGEREMLCCQASDLMSDVLSTRGPGAVLLTGLANIQAIRTAEISDFAAVCFVRGKSPSAEVLALAEEKGIALMVTPLSMFEACGRLYARGLRSSPGGKEAAHCPTQG